jgi:dipeptidase
MHLPLLAAALSLLAARGEACTALICGRKATADGSVMASHSSDGGGTLDPRLVRVPARDFPRGARRAVYPSPEVYPRYVGADRQVEEYLVENCQAGADRCTDLAPMGYVPQVSHTYSYFECTYGVMNEHQVGIAESTCSGVFTADPINMQGKALFSVDALSQVALERSRTSREAVETMGRLAEEHGFYGAESSFEGSAESLMVTDPSEGWVFHILPDPTGASAIWAAQRVPDDSVAVVANMFIIREMNMSDTASFLGSANMWDIARKEGLWSEGEPMDFTKTFSDGEYAHKYYSGRRMWGSYRLLSPQTALSAEYGNLKADAPYPFAAPVAKLLTPADFMTVHRDWYNGTAYSMSAPGVLAGGAFESPDRYSGGPGEAAVAGSWERSIALFRTASSFIVQSKAYASSELGGVIWWGSHAPHGTCYVPILPGSMLSSPSCLAHVYQGVYDLTTSFWAHRSVLNLAQIKFSYIIKDIEALQLSLEATSAQLVTDVVTKYSGVSELTEDMKSDITEMLSNNIIQVRDSFVSLFYQLVFKYADGYINTVSSSGSFSSSSTGYPAWWLEDVGYSDGPPPVDATAAAAAGAAGAGGGGAVAGTGAGGALTAYDSIGSCIGACLDRDVDDAAYKLCTTCCMSNSAPC